jgi:hypothetical protein
VIGPEGTDAIVDALLTMVYAREIAFTIQLARATGDPVQSIANLLTTEIVAPNDVVDSRGWRVQTASKNGR